MALHRQHASRQYEGSQERSILAALVVNRTVLGSVASQWTQEGLFASRWANLVAGWCVSFYEAHKAPPGANLVSLFTTWAEEESRDESITREVEGFITNLETDMVAASQEINEGHIIDLAGKLFNKNRLKVLLDSARQALEVGDTLKAELAVQKYRRVEIGQGVGINLLEDEDAGREAFADTQRSIISFSGDLKEFYGDAFSRDCFVAFSGPEKRGKCAPECALILLADGRIKTIRQVVEEKITTPVVTLNEETQKFEPMQVSDFWDNGVKECWEVTTRSGRKVATTRNHRYLTPDGWKFLEDITLSEFIAVPKKLGFFGDQPMPEAELKFLAYMLADGCCVRNGDYGIASSFTKTDPILVEDFKSVCAALGISYKQYGVSYHLSKSRPLMRKLGLAGKSSRTKVIPDCVFTCPREQIALFLRIFFSCDGYLVEGREIGLSLTSEKMTQQISHLLIRMGIVHRFYRKEKKYKGEPYHVWIIDIRSAEYVELFNKEIGMLSYKGDGVRRSAKNKSFIDKFPHQVAKRFYEELRSEYDHIQAPEHIRRAAQRDGYAFREMFGEKKAGSIREQIAKKLPLMRQSFAHADPSSPTVQKYMGSEILWDEIVAIENVGWQKTYDLTVPVHHNFVANDCVVHNTRYLLDLSWRALWSRRKVAFFACGDMTRNQMLRRFFSRAACRPIKAGRVRIPTELRLRQEDNQETFDIEYEEREYAQDLDWIEGKRAFDRIKQRYVRSHTPHFKLHTASAGTLTVSAINGYLDRWEADEGWVADCVIEGSLVLTDRGEIPIEKVSGSDRLWDGTQWVRHGGPVFKGIRDVITYAGLTATPDHQIWTRDGWRTLESCRNLGLPVSRTGVGGSPVRVGRDYISDRSSAGPREKLSEVCVCQMCEMRSREVVYAEQPESRYCVWMQEMYAAEEIPWMVCPESVHGSAEMSESQKHSMGAIRWQGDRVSIPFGGGSVFVDYREFGGDGQRTRTRSHRQRRPLRTGESPILYSEAEYLSHPQAPDNPANAQIPAGSSRCDVCGRNFDGSDRERTQRKADRREVGVVPEKVRRHKAPVWDIINSGPLHRFTVQGLLAHNCVVIDYADILAPARGINDTREKINDIWISLRAMSSTRHCLVVTATQTNRQSYKAKIIGMEHSSEDKRKLSHITGMLSLNCTNEEKEAGITRLNWTSLREEDNRPTRCLWAAGCPAISNPIIQAVLSK